MAVNFRFDPTTFVTALAALFAAWVAFRESRRNNAVIVKMRNCCLYSFSSSASSERYKEFRVTIENLGRPMHDVVVRLAFDTRGLWAARHGCRMQTADEKDGWKGEFAKGMVAEFSFFGKDMGGERGPVCRELKKPAVQDARIEVFSQGHLAESFRVGGWWDHVKWRWYSEVRKVKERWEKRLDGKRQGVRRKTYRRGWFEWLVRPVVIWGHLERFIEICIEDGDDAG